MIGPELSNLGESWAPFIAPWCIKLIMDIATEKANLPSKCLFFNRYYFTPGLFQLILLLLFADTTLQNTDPVRVLLDITTQNLTLLNAEERAKCIDMMLGESKLIF